MRHEARRTQFLTILLVLTAVSQAPRGSAQSPPVTFEPTGLQPGKGYFGQFGFERVDMMLGSLNLTFEDLVLPGSAGMDLRFVRYFGRSGPDPGQWGFGLAGIPFRVRHPTPARPTARFV